MMRVLYMLLKINKEPDHKNLSFHQLVLIEHIFFICGETFGWLPKPSPAPSWPSPTTETGNPDILFPSLARSLRWPWDPCFGHET